MGKSYINIDIDKALLKAKTWEVTEASTKEYFEIEHRLFLIPTIKSAMIEESEKEIVFNLCNGDFIQMEGK